MRIKMYTKVTCYSLEEMPYEKIMCIAYDSIDDINIVDGEDIFEDTEVSCFFGDTDGDVPCIGRYPFISQDPVKMVEKILGIKKYENIGKEISKIALAKNTKIFDCFEDADRDIPLGKPVIYPHDLWNRRRSLRI